MNIQPKPSQGNPNLPPDALRVVDIYVFQDGDSYCAVYHDFVNLAESQSGWGDDPQQAIHNLVNDTLRTQP